jgi:hypothetical protein
VQYLLADDEGHGFARPVNNMALFAASEKFLAKYLGGRFQESMTPEVTKRLGEMTIDPTTVSMPKPASTSSGASADLTGKWAMVADAGSQTVPMTVELKQTGIVFVGSTLSHLGNGKIEGGKLDGKSFTAVLTAEIQGQPVEFAMQGSIEGDKVTGTLTNAAFGAIPFSGTRTK